MNDTLSRALSNPDTLRSFATLDRHRMAGRFDREAALRLLRRNARDACPYRPSHERDRLARLLYATWHARYVRADPLGAAADGLEPVLHVARYREAQHARDRMRRAARNMR